MKNLNNEIELTQNKFKKIMNQFMILFFGLHSYGKCKIKNGIKLMKNKNNIW